MNNLANIGLQRATVKLQALVKSRSALGGDFSIKNHGHTELELRVRIVAYEVHSRFIDEKFMGSLDEHVEALALQVLEQAEQSLSRGYERDQVLRVLRDSKAVSLQEL